MSSKGLDCQGFVGARQRSARRVSCLERGRLGERRDLNPRVMESQSSALPLGYARHETEYTPCHLWCQFPPPVGQRWRGKGGQHGKSAPLHPFGMSCMAWGCATKRHNRCDATGYQVACKRVCKDDILLEGVANSMVEYSAFNRLVPGSSPGQPNFRSNQSLSSAQQEKRKHGSESVQSTSAPIAGTWRSCWKTLIG